MEVESTPEAVSSGVPRHMVRSCITCSKAKAKCVKAPGKEACERCLRLKKECSTKVPVPRRRKMMKPSRAAQLENLENKIEHLVSALSSSQTLSANGQPSPAPSTSERGGTTVSETLQNICEKIEEETNPRPPPPSTALGLSAGVFNGHVKLPVNVDNYGCLGVTLDEADVLLDRWRRLMAPGLPFVIVPSGVTAHQLHCTKPLLLHAIVTVAYFHNFPRQQLLVRWLMRDISERILMDGEKNVGILQALLVFIAWYHPHAFTGQQLTNLLHLAIAMSVDLGIHRVPESCLPDPRPTKGHDLRPVQRDPTLEEKRALAGVFYLSSMLSITFRKSDALPYTRHMDNFLTDLAKAGEYDSDLILVQMVRLQNLAEEIYSSESSSAPLHMVVKLFETDLDKLKTSDPCKDISDTTFLRLQYLATEIYIWELSLNGLQENKTDALREHLDDIYRCVNAVKAFTNVFFSMSPASYLTTPFSFFGQFAHAYMVLMKLVCLEIEGWDMVRLQILDFGGIAEHVAAMFEESARSSPDGLRVNNECFMAWAKKTRRMKQLCEAKFMPQQNRDQFSVQEKTDSVCASTRPAEGHREAAMAGVQQPTPSDDVFSGDFFNYLDDGFWNSLDGDYDLALPDIAMN